MIRIFWLAALLTISAAHNSSGDEIARGEELALRWCSGCHVIGPDAAGGDAGPPFPAIAARPEQSEAALQTWIAMPHPPMPDLDLAAPELDALTKYILSLKDGG